jgi:hypothetical protein
MTLPATVSHAVKQMQEWLKELRDNGDLANENDSAIGSRSKRRPISVHSCR